MTCEGIYIAEKRSLCDIDTKLERLWLINHEFLCSEWTTVTGVNRYNFNHKKNLIDY